jgi:hypothetical protein
VPKEESKESEAHMTLRALVALLTTSLAFALASPTWASESFGVESFATSIEARGPIQATQAGSHPSSLTTTVVFKHAVSEEKEDFETNAKGEAVPLGEPEVSASIDGNPRRLAVSLPPGLIVDPAAIRVRCTEGQLETNPSSGGSCPAASAVGVLTFYLNGFGEKIKATVYDMESQSGVPAELGVDAGEVGLIVHIVGRLSAGGDYRFSAEVAEITQSVSIYGLSLTLWGEPSGPSHDAQRGVCASSGPVQKEIEQEKYENENLLLGKSEGKYRFSCPTEEVAAPLLTLPTSCTNEPLATMLSVDSWQEPGALEPDGTPDLSDPRWRTATSSSPPVTGCEHLDFSPSLTVQPAPESPSAESPSGLNVDLKLPHEETVEGIAEADLKQLTVTLPPGMAISPSVASGLGACAPSEIDLHGEAPPSCPKSSILGEVEVTTPLLEAPLKGAVYLAQPETFEGALVGLYVVAAGDGVLIKLGAQATLDPGTGQVTLALNDSPQLPIDEIRLSLFGGPRAPLQTPPGCGRYEAHAALVPWSSDEPVPASSSFEVTTGPDGGACPDGQFDPSFIAGTTNSQAGAFSPFTITLSRRDGEQHLAGMRVTAPPGLLGMLGSVAQCPEPQASTGQCPAASEIGEATLAAGPGEDPYWLRGGKLYLTGPTSGGQGPNPSGAPFGLAIVTPALAGPFNLGGAGGDIVTRARVRVDSHTAQVTIESYPLPTILDGIPLDIRTINLTIGRPGFMFNPTSCAPMSVTGSLESTGGASVAVTSPFEAVNCSSLPFEPKLTASTQARTSRPRGASLSVRITSGPGQANVGKVRVILPKQLPARLTTLQKACPDTTFDANPASCPAASVVGMATAVTRLLAHPLTGPAYLVAHGGIAFPDLVFVLQGEGIEMYLDGNMDIKKSFTSSTFNSIPDVPIATFTATFPEGPHSILASDLLAGAKGGMCGQRLTMPTAITGQNGALQTQSTKIAVSGCPKRPRGGRRSKGKRKRDR